MVFYFGWSSAEVRSFTANALRTTANWIEPKGQPKVNPKVFQIPNPFYINKEKD